MPFFDQWDQLPDTYNLQAGQVVRFKINSVCAPFAAPSAAQVTAGFAATSLSISAVDQDFPASITPGLYSATVKAEVLEVVSVGSLKGQILSAMQVVDGAKSVPCAAWGIVSNEIDLQTAVGDGGNSPNPLAPSLPTTAAIIAVAVLAVVAFLFYKEII